MTGFNSVVTNAKFDKKFQKLDKNLECYEN